MPDRPLAAHGSWEGPLRLDPNPCLVCWGGCLDIYNGVHSCVRHGAHAGSHRCACDATTRIKGGTE